MLESLTRERDREREKERERKYSVKVQCSVMHNSLLFYLLLVMSG